MTVKPPSPKFIEAANYGGEQKVLKWVVLHSTVSPSSRGWAEKIARYFAQTERDASAHYVTDTHERRQCVPDHRVAYHCGYNQGSIAVEMCEVPDWNKKRWDDEEHRLLEINSARLVARLCAAYKIRPYYVGPIGLRLGIKGVTTHKAMTKAFKKSTHWDPGAWRKRRFMRQVRKHYRYLKLKTS